MQILTHLDICNKIEVTLLTMIYSYDSKNHSGRQKLKEFKKKSSSSPQKQHDNGNPHMKALHNLASKASLLFQQ